MLSSHSQLARACRALCTTVALALLPHGAAWAVDYRVTLDPPDGFIIRDVPLLVTATVTPVPATGRVSFWVGNEGPRYPQPLDTKGRACIQIDQADLDQWSSGSSYVGAVCDDGQNPGRLDSVRYYYDPTPARATSPRVGANSTEPGQHLTMTALTPIPPNPVAGNYLQLSAQMTDCQDGSVYPQGRVTFCDGDEWLGETYTDGVGVANYTFPAVYLRLGSNLVTAYFEGNAGFARSADSATVTLLGSRGTAKAEAKPSRSVPVDCINPPR